METSQAFLNKLKNFEKQRTKDLFQNYSLHFPEQILKKMNLTQNPISTKISVVGTNGKGSTAYYLSKLIQKNSLGKVGLYLSPHLYTERERVQVNGNYFSYAELNEFLKAYQDLQKEFSQLSYFEFLTLFAIAYFRKYDCKFEIYEAGLGGRLDATKLAKADFIVITKIGLDHTQILGETLEKILEEKLHIFTENCKGIFYFPQEDPNLDKRIEQFCLEKNIECYPFFEKLEDYLTFNLNYAKFILETILNSKLNFIELEPIQGRMEVLIENPMVLFDVGHNPDAIKFLISSIQKRYARLKWNILLGCLPDKDLKSILEIFRSWNKTHKIYILTKPPFTKPNFEHSEIEIENVKSLDFQKNLLITGSFRLCEILPELKKLF